MEKKKELTWEYLKSGAEELQKLFDSCDYAEGDFLIRESKEEGYVFLNCDQKKALNSPEKEYPIIKHKVSASSGQISDLDICVFSRMIYDHLISIEQDESEISDLCDVSSGLSEWKTPNINKMKFFHAYEAVHDRKPSILTFKISEVDNLSEEQKKEAIKVLDEEYFKLRVGGAIKIEGIKTLRELGLQAKLNDVYRYEGDKFGTVWPETHKFKMDLERAVQFELLSQI